MGENSHISWTDNTWNPWHGCKKVSDGCKFCYMYRDKERHGQKPDVVLRSKTMFKEPLKWAKKGVPAGTKIFTCSWSDFFIDEADAWRAEAWDIIKQTPQFTYQILTKRPERILKSTPADYFGANEDAMRYLYEHVLLGVSIEKVKNLERLTPLFQFPAMWQRFFVSFEPLLEDIKVPLYQMLDKMAMESGAAYLADRYWFIIGGESGNEEGKYRYRECSFEWIDGIMEVADKFNIPVFVKQAGTHIAKRMGYRDRAGANILELPLKYQRQEFFK